MIRWLSALGVLALCSSVSHAGLDLTWNACNQGPGNSGSITFSCDGSTTPRLFGNFQSTVTMPGVTALEAVLDIGMDGASLPPFWHFEDAGCNAGGLTVSDARPGAQCPPALHATPWGIGGVSAEAFVTAYYPGFHGGGRARALLAVIRSSSDPVTVTAGQNYYAFHIDVLGDESACSGCGTPAEIHWSSGTFYAAAESWTLTGPGIRSNWVAVNGGGPASRVFAVDPRVVFNDSSRVLTVLGYGLVTGAGASLVGGGGSQIPGQSLVVAADGSALSGQFDVVEAAGGLWDLVVTAPAGSDTLYGALDLQEAFRLSSIAPDRVSRTGWVNVAIHGFGMVQGARAVLTRTATDSLVGYSPTVSADGRTLWTRFDPTASVPAPWNLFVRLADGRSAGIAGGFEIVASSLALHSVTPGSGAPLGGTRVLLRGAGLASGLTARLTRAGEPDLPGQDVTVAPTGDSAWVTFDLQGWEAGPAYAMVENPDGVATMLTTPFQIVAPLSVTAIDPASGRDFETIVAVLTGSGFDPETVVQLERGAETIVGTVLQPVNPGTIPVRLPLAGRTNGWWDVVVLRGPARDVLPDAFEIRPEAPAATAVAPVFGGDDGPAVITITGSAFHPGLGARLLRGAETIVGTSVFVIDSAQATAQFDLTDRTLGWWDVAVSLPGAGDTLPAAFEVRARFRIDSIVPNQFRIDSVATVQITGRNMPPGTVVALKRSGQPDISGQSTLVAPDGRSLVTGFDLHGAEVGAWDVVASTPGDSTWTLPQAFTVELPPVAVPGDRTDRGFGLVAIRPNPSRGRMRVEYSLPREGVVRLVVVDLQGREVAELAAGVRDTGMHAVEWDGTSRGRAIATGIYFVRCESGGRSSVRRFAIAR